MAPNKIPIQGRRLRNSPKETEVLVRWPQRSEFPNVVAKAIQPPWPPPNRSSGGVPSFGCLCVAIAQRTESGGTINLVVSVRCDAHHKNELFKLECRLDVCRDLGCPVISIWAIPDQAIDVSVLSVFPIQRECSLVDPALTRARPEKVGCIFGCRRSISAVPDWR